MDAVIRQAFEHGLGDARVRLISWTEDDLVLDLVLPSLPVRTLRVCFKMIARLRIDFDYGEYVGQPLLFSAAAQEIETGRWTVRFEFGGAPEGLLEFECREISELPSV